jgi:hypothetical protein
MKNMTDTQSNQTMSKGTALGRNTAHQSQERARLSRLLSVEKSIDVSEEGIT